MKTSASLCMPVKTAHQGFAAWNTRISDSNTFYRGTSSLNRSFCSIAWENTVDGILSFHSVLTFEVALYLAQSKAKINEVQICSSFLFNSTAKLNTILMFTCFPFFLFLLLLHSQLYLWGSPFLLRVLRMWPFFNLTIKVVAFHLHGWCMLWVLLLLAFTHQGHKCQDVLSLCYGMHVCTD